MADLQLQEINPEFVRAITYADGGRIAAYLKTEISVVNDPGANVFLAVFVGVITGVGGGVLRDVLSGNTPYIFVKHFYACASLIGAIFCAVFWPILGSVPAMLIGAIMIVVLRNLAAHYRWSLPRIEE